MPAIWESVFVLEEYLCFAHTAAAHAVQALRVMEGARIASTLYLAMSLTERLVLSYRFKPLDVCIVRPSLAIGAAKTPWPGYVGAPRERAATLTVAAVLALQHCPICRHAMSLSASITSTPQLTLCIALGMQARGVASREASWALPSVRSFSAGMA